MFFKKKYYIHLILLIVVVLGATLTVAQDNSKENIKVVQMISQDTIMIGDQVDYKVTITKDVGQIVSVPDISKNSQKSALEIIGNPIIDTLSVDGREVTLEITYKMTSFDAGIYSLGRFPILVQDKNVIDTVFSVDSSFLVVNTYDIDTASYVVAPIKSRIDDPITFEEMWYYVANTLKSPVTYIVIIVIIILILSILYYIKHRKRPKKLVSTEPPHVIAIKELEKIHSEKLWQNGKHKQYYTRITDVVRIYLEDRYGVNAMEMTTDEIMSAMKKIGISENDKEKIQDLLSISDFVKFAKLSPSEDDNERSYYNAYYFVEDTKEAVLKNVNNVESNE